VPSPFTLLVLLSALVAVGTSTPALAQDADPTFQDIASIRAVAGSFVAAQVAPTAQVEASALDPRTRMPLCAQPLRASPASAPANGHWNVAVSCSQPRTWTLYVPVVVTERQKVLVLKRNLRAGDPIDADAVTLETRDTARLAYGYFTDPSQVAGKVARRPLALGSALTPDSLSAPLSVHRGQTVTLLARGAGVEVRAQGKALSDGGSGDLVQVQNLSSKRVVQGTVQPDGSVQIAL
jgi:flagella basal body P-ring formation protein FlgA